MSVAGTSPTLRVPTAPVLLAGPGQALWLSADGEVESLEPAEAGRRAAATAPIVCHAAATAARLDCPPFRAFDLLELFAFVHPARFCLPTPAGLADALGLEPPPAGDPAAQAVALLQAAPALLSALQGDPGHLAAARRIATTMGEGGWPWAPAVLAALGVDQDGGPRGSGLDAWTRLPPWEDRAPPPPPSDAPIGGDESRARLADLLDAGAEPRPEQSDYAAAVAAAFQPRDQAGAPNIVLAEAGTGVGKTLGYIAPASLWAERNGGAVWISTYTRNLQRQVDQELDRLYPEPALKRRRAVVRKGRENYLCLLNLEEAARGATARGGDAVALGLLTRWAEASRDGDMIGGDFPAWLAGVVGRRRTLDLTDHRGECIYSACPHYSRCFVEISRRRARHAEIVVANHALVMIQAARGDDGQLPTRYVFDEGHHIFDAADNAFSAHLSGQEGGELRRWIRGPEAGRRRSRGRGMEARLGDLAAGLPAAEQALGDAVRAAAALAGPGWLRRIAEGAPGGGMETFLARVHQQVLARADNAQSPYGLEAGTAEPVPGLLEAADALDVELLQLHKPLQALRAGLLARLEDEADELDSASRVRIEAAGRGLKRRLDMLAAWRSMLAALHDETPEEFVDWFGVDRIAGRDVDIGMHRHWVDPTVPFARTTLTQAHGVAVTSATLRDSAAAEATDWSAAEVRTGALHLPQPALRVSLASPFDHVARSRVFIVTDVRRNDVAQVAAAYRALFEAAAGGGLGLFTAIQRLRAVHQRIAGPLGAAGLPLYAQHVDVMDTGTLVDMFRAEEDACLLGTDAVRDGVDVPGRALRLIVFDRVPWPRPDLLHRARKRAFGGSAYDDMLVRFRLKQAYGRLLRRAGDAGVFVLLDPMLPSRLLPAFPEGVEIVRTGLAEVVDATRDFLAETGT